MRMAARGIGSTFLLLLIRQKGHTQVGLLNKDRRKQGYV